MAQRIFNKITSEAREMIVEQIQAAERIVVTDHISADDDSIASALGVHYYITQVLKHQGSVEIAYPGERMDRWDGLELYSNVSFHDEIAPLVEQADLVIFVDGNQWERFSHAPMPEIPSSVCIDHHRYEETPFDTCLIDPTSASSAEIVADLLYRDEDLDRTISPVLLMGIISDSGHFRHVTPENAHVMSTARRLVERGEVNVQKFLATYSRSPLSVHEPYAKLLANARTFQVGDWPQGMYSYLDRSELGSDVSDDQMSSAAHMFVYYLLGLRGISWGFVATAREDGGTRISFRSIAGGVNVMEVARDMGIGGGHDLAAGARFPDLKPHEAAERIVSWLEENEPRRHDTDSPR